MARRRADYEESTQLKFQSLSHNKASVPSCIDAVSEIDRHFIKVSKKIQLNLTLLIPNSTFRAMTMRYDEITIPNADNPQ